MLKSQTFELNRYKMQNKSPLELTDKIFFEENDFDLNKVQSLLSKTLIDADDGELYLESTKSEAYRLRASVSLSSFHFSRSCFPSRSLEQSPRGTSSRTRRRARASRWPCRSGAGRGPAYRRRPARRHCPPGQRHLSR